MSAHSIAITYQAIEASIVADPLWLRLEQEALPSDIATVADAAALVDELYQIDPCTEPAPAEETAEPETMDDQDQPTVDDLAAAAQKTLDLAVCSLDPDGSCTIKVLVIRARIDLPYRLRITGGEVVSVVQVQEMVTRTMTIDGGNSVTLDYPVVGPCSVAWMGAPSGGDPDITRTGNTFHWSGEITGQIRAEYLTIYDLVEIKVFGSAEDPGKPGEAFIRCFYHGLVEELTPELPEPAELDRSLCPHPRLDEPGEDRVTCYRTITVHERCRCSKTEINNYAYDREESCPEDAPKNCPNNLADCMHNLGGASVVSWVECPGDKHAPGSDDEYPLSSTDFYAATCCHPLPNDQSLPFCPYETSAYAGGAKSPHDLAYYQGIYGPTTRLVGRSPVEGCGVWEVEIKVRPADCCDQAEPLGWDTTTSPETMGTDSTALVAVTGGRLTKTWTIRGFGFSIGNKDAKTVEMMTSHAVVYTEGACGIGVIKVTDGCSTTYGYIRATSGVWEPVPEEEWPAPAMLSEFSEAENPELSSYIRDLTAYWDKYKVKQRMSGADSTHNRESSYIGFEQACALMDAAMPGLIADQQGKYINQYPEYISRSVVGQLYDQTGWIPKSYFYGGKPPDFPWEVCAEGIMCIDNQQWYDPYYAPHYYCGGDAARLENGPVLGIWQWRC